MRNHRRVWFVILSLAALGVLIWLILPAGEPEPVYQGKSLRHWLAFFTATQGNATPDDRTQAVEALRKIGTNAIPALLEMLQEKDSPLKLKWIALLQKQHLFKPPQRAMWRNYQAAKGFEALGATASNAVPTLVQVYRMKISEISQEETLVALGAIGPAASPAATPVLQDALTNLDDRLRSSAVMAIDQIHSQPEVFVPALINALKDSDAGVRHWAAMALAKYGAAAKPAVPALIAILNDPDPYVRVEAANALKSIDPVAAMPALINALKDSYGLVRALSAIALARYGPAAKPAVPALIALLNDADPGVRVEAASALKAIDPVAAANAGIK